MFLLVSLLSDRYVGVSQTCIYNDEMGQIENLFNKIDSQTILQEYLCVYVHIDVSFKKKYLLIIKINNQIKSIYWNIPIKNVIRAEK